jgi:hypothetical protein
MYETTNAQTVIWIWYFSKVRCRVSICSWVSLEVVQPFWKTSTARQIRSTGILKFQPKSAFERVIWILIAFIVYHLKWELRGVYVRICIGCLGVPYVSFHALFYPTLVWWDFARMKKEGALFRHQFFKWCPVFASFAIVGFLNVYFWIFGGGDWKNILLKSCVFYCFFGFNRWVWRRWFEIS